MFYAQEFNIYIHYLLRLILWHEELIILECIPAQYADSFNTFKDYRSKDFVRASFTIRSFS